MIFSYKNIPYDINNISLFAMPKKSNDTVIICFITISNYTIERCEFSINNFDLKQLTKILNKLNFVYCDDCIHKKVCKYYKDNVIFICKFKTTLDEKIKRRNALKYVPDNSIWQLTIFNKEAKL